jgi:hypothetical protein
VRSQVLAADNLKLSVFFIVVARIVVVLQKLTEVSEAFTASINKATRLKRRSISARPHGATTQKTLVLTTYSVLELKSLQFNVCILLLNDWVMESLAVFL